jgi:acetyltransferase-like isoleucine patch superfamily enzyme
VNWLTTLRRKAISCLASALERETARRRLPPCAVIALGATVFPEAVIENLAGTPEAIDIGSNSVVRGRLLTYANAGRIKIGSWCFIGARSEIWSMASITIGDRVLISHNVNIIDNTGHSRDPVERHEHFRRIMQTGHPRDTAELPGIVALPVVIEDDVWINCNVTILKGVRIGARSIIAAGAIVTKDVPPDTIYRNEFRGITSSRIS